MASRTAITRLTSQPLASSSRIPWMAPTSHPLPHRKAIAHLRPPKTSTLPISGYRRRASTSVAPHPSPGLPPISLKLKMRVTPPSLRAIQEEGYQNDDVVLIPSHEAVLILTPEAVQQLVSITSREPSDVLAQGKLVLRCGVSSGGCHGYQYTMALTEERGVDDYVIQPEGVNCIPVVVDLVSLGLLKGATLHHATELIGSSFRIQDNPQAKEGGACGCGISWEAKM
ncbi:MAG: [4Fe-4S] proteins maturation [Tremellales sp. Tagirdzhanova-0007]|nr:MAG: [4Fe-4S] proteins maturation [Tremellales sp. Tagirdzhanova-0007]